MLKTDYKDAMYDGARKYKITSNADGTSGIQMKQSIRRKGIPLEQTISIPQTKLSTV